MTGFLLTLTTLIAVVVALPYWEYSRKWGNAPSFLLGLLTFVFGFLWATKQI